MFKRNAIWLVPILLMAVITPFTPWLDLTVSRYFYTPGNGAPGRFVSNPFVEGMYLYGELPALLTAFFAAVLLVLSYVLASLKKWRSPFLVLLLAITIGPGIIINSLLKEYWGRPRPIQVIEFGGIQQFRPYYSPDFSNPIASKSFTCGHCSVGFYFFALALVGRRLKNKGMEYLGWALAIALGLSLSYSRIAAGGHFLSDALMSALIVWLACLLSDWLVYDERVL